MSNTYHTVPVETWFNNIRVITASQLHVPNTEVKAGAVWLQWHWNQLPTYYYQCQQHKPSVIIITVRLTPIQYIAPLATNNLQTPEWPDPYQFGESW